MMKFKLAVGVLAIAGLVGSPLAADEVEQGYRGQSLKSGKRGAGNETAITRPNRPVTIRRTLSVERCRRCKHGEISRRLVACDVFYTDTRRWSTSACSWRSGL